MDFVALQVQRTAVVSRVLAGKVVEHQVGVRHVVTPSQGEHLCLLRPRGDWVPLRVLPHHVVQVKAACVLHVRLAEQESVLHEANLNGSPIDNDCLRRRRVTDGQRSRQ